MLRVIFLSLLFSTGTITQEVLLKLQQKENVLFRVYLFINYYY